MNEAAQLEILQIVGRSYPEGGRSAVADAWDLDGWCPAAKGLDIFQRIQQLSEEQARPLTCIELGVFAGKSLFCQAVALQHCHFGGFVTGIDPYSPEACAEGFDLQSHTQREHVEWWLHNSDLATIERSCRQVIIQRHLGQFCQVVTGMPDVWVDHSPRLHWLHLDDCHSPVASLRNAQAWVPKLLPGGLLMLDDAHWPTMRTTRNWIAERLTLISERRSEGHQWEVYHA